MNSVLDRLRDASPAIRKQFRLRSLGVYGSYAKNANHSGSDLDVLYDLEENARLSFKDYILLEETIARQTGVAEVDLVQLRNINPLVWMTVKNTIVYV